MMTLRMAKIIADTDNFLNNYTEGSTMNVSLSSAERSFLNDYISNHPNGGKDFQLVPGIFKPGRLEHDYCIQKK